MVSCPVCESAQLTFFFDMLQVPIFSNIIRKSQNEAINCSKGDVKLAFCSNCNYITNAAFDTKLINYEQQFYENSLDYSPRFHDYSGSLARGLVERYNLFGKYIIEIGCGNGNFLSTLCKLGNSRGEGFDPGNFEGRVTSSTKSNQIKLIQDHYSKKYSNIQADLIVCRQTLEHIADPKRFLIDLRKIIGSQSETNIFFEVPNALSIFRRNYCWDIIYEHCSYFTRESLSAIFSLSGFNICEITESFGGQFLCLYAKPIASRETCSYYQPNDARLVTSYVTSLNTNWKNRINRLRNKLDEIKSNKQRCVVWGAGSKAVTFLNVFKDSPITYVVDINPHKQGNYMAGTGQKIVPPEFLSTYCPDFLIVMNPIYTSEIAILTKRLKVSPQFIWA
jgi:hypothetical protein